MDRVLPAHKFHCSLRAALRELCEEDHLGYVFAPDVFDVIEVNLPEQTTREDLDAILKPVGCKYTYQDRTILVQLDARRTKEQPIKEGFECSDACLPLALKATFESVSATYSISSEIKKRATCRIDPARDRLELLLQPILNSVDATYRYEGGVFMVLPKKQ